MTGVRAPMIGRDRDLATLAAAFAKVEHGSAASFVISGEAGIGKSRLVREFLAGIGDRAAILVGECADSGSGPIPFAAAQGLLAGVRRLAEADSAFAAAGALAAELAEGRFDEVQDRWLVAVADLFAAVAAVRPVVLVVEDLHWVDGGTLDALRFALSRNRELPILALLTFRIDDLGRRHPLRTVLAELERARVIDRLALERLEEPDALRLAATLAGGAASRDALAAVVERGDGVPFYIEELVNCYDVDVAGLGDLLLARYLALSAPTQRLLRIAAAAGGPIRHDLLALVVGIPDIELEEAIREALEASVLIVEDDAYRFRHALMREAVADELLPGERVRIHTAYAEALEAGSSSVPVLAAVADHWWMARDVERAFAAALHALRGGRAVTMGSIGSRMGERVLELWTRVADPEAHAGCGRHEVLVMTASALRSDGNLTRAHEALREAVAEWPADDPVGRARALVRLREIMPEIGQSGGGELLDEALELLGPTGHDDVRAALLIEMTRGNLLTGGFHEEAVALATQAYDAATAAGAPSLASVAINLRGVTRVHSGDDGGFDDLEQARILAGDDERALVRYHLNTSDCYLARGMHATALRIAEEGAVIARKGWAGTNYYGSSSANAIEALIWLGEWDRAEAWLQELDHRLEPTIYAAWIRTHRLSLLLQRGDLEAAEAYHRANRPLFERQAAFEVQTRGPYTMNLALLHHLRGHDGEALEVVQGLLDRPRPLDPAYDTPTFGIAGRILAATGADPVPYRAQLDTLVIAPMQPLWSAVFEAELADRGWRDLADRYGPAWLRPYALMREGRRLLTEGDRAAARTELLAARDAASHLGAMGTVRAAAELLGAAGSAAPATGPEALSPREQQVLDLIAEGLTNAQIAQRLFISVKTVSIHVSAVLRKLGVASRTEAAVRARA